MNRPGIMDGKNWLWRATHEQINDKLAEDIAYLTTLYARN
jgi:4-alpha-glucanotransferase